jgi:hypothetical protein
VIKDQVNEKYLEGIEIVEYETVVENDDVL